MRNNYLLAVVMTLIIISCKKETKEIISETPVAFTDGSYTICIDEKWVTEVATQEIEADLVVAYNNKSYFFHNNWNLALNDPRRKKIRIFDGSDWEVKSSNMPQTFEPSYINFAFVIGNYAYIGYTCNYLGNSSHGETWKYGFITNNWTPVDDFPDYNLTGAAYFTVGNKGYVVGGQRQGPSYPNLYKTWEFNPSASTQWTQKANLPGVGRHSSVGFAIGSKGYLVSGKTSLPNPYGDFYYTTLFEYNPANDNWTIKSPYPATGRESGKSFVIDNKAYVGGGFTRDGNDFTYLYDFYEYSQTNDEWKRIENYASNGKVRQCFTINSKAYAVWKPAADVSTEPLKMKRYIPVKCTVINTPNTGNVSTTANN